MLDELKIRYKESKPAVRLSLCAVLAFVPALLTYSDESPLLDEEYTKAEVEERTAAKKLVEADNLLKNLAKAEDELRTTKDQLEKAEERLPNEVMMDEVLRFIGKTSKSSGVRIAFFEPQKEVLQGSDYKYYEVPIKLTAEATDFGKMCEWLDEMAGSNSKIYLKSWKMSRKGIAEADRSNVKPIVKSIFGSNLSESEMSEIEGTLSRKRMRLVLEADLSMFKLAQNVPEAPENGKKQEEKPDPNKPAEQKKTDSQSTSTDQGSMRVARGVR